MKDSKKQSARQKYLHWWIFLYFFVPLIGLLFLFEFLNQDKMSKYERDGFGAMFAFHAALIWAAMEFLTKGKSVKLKAIAGVLLFIALVVINLIVRLKS